jgi:hypothetical protein
MTAQRCPGLDAQHAQHDEPRWQPLLDSVGERLASGFMWMHEDELEDGVSVQAYKHIHTRRYLYLADDGRAFEIAACDRYAPLRLDFAIEQALCTWWLLKGWEPEDVEAIRDAVERACRSAGSAP